MGFLGLEATKKTKGVGVVMMPDFKWDNQHKMSARRSRKGIHGFKLIISCMKSGVFLLLYKATALPHLEYGAQLG